MQCLLIIMKGWDHGHSLTPLAGGWRRPNGDKSRGVGAGENAFMHATPPGWGSVMELEGPKFTHKVHPRHT